MIEKCSYCGEEHETGEGFTLGGVPMKECPNVPPNTAYLLPFTGTGRFEHPIDKLQTVLDEIAEEVAATFPLLESSDNSTAAGAKLVREMFESQ